jgi:spermidine synthase
VVGSRFLVLVLFFLSGASSLIYQVLWTRQLSLIFGVTIFAASAVLAAFMGGLALGSYWIGRTVDRHPNPVRVYAYLEAGIGVCGLAIPLIFGAIQPLYVALAALLEDRFLLFNFARALLISLPLLVPTILMGGTVPAIARYLVKRKERVGWNVGLLYAVNTFGAVAGCVVAGFALIRYLGLANTAYTAVAVNLGIAAILLLGRVGDSVEVSPRSRDRGPAEVERWDSAAILAMLVFAVSGFAALGYEILWTRVLVVHIHNSSYAFTLMLAVFLSGLAIGDALLVRVYDRIRRPLFWLGILQIATGLSVIVAAAAYRSVRELSLGILGIEGLSSWGEAVALMSLRTGLVLLPSTVLLGMTFPLVGRIVSGNMEGFGRRLGTAYAANTTGAILGALVAAFVLIPWLGLRGTLVSLSGLTIFLGAVCAAADLRGTLPRATFATAGLALALAPAFFVSETIFHNAMEGRGWNLIYYHEGITDTTGVWEHEKSGERYLTYGDQRGTAGTLTSSVNRRQAHIAHLLHAEPVHSLQIGFGVGNTLAAAELHPEVEVLDCVELSPHVTDTAPFFWTNEGVLDKPGVELIIDDGRNFLLRSRERYDVITLEPPEIFTADIVNLYTVEFYRLAFDALSEDGLLVQWLPTYTMEEEDTQMLVAAVLNAFPEVSLWNQGPFVEMGSPPYSTLVVVGSKKPLRIDLAELRRRMNHPSLRADLEKIETGSPAALLGLYVAGTERLRQWVGDLPAVTDDRTIVDYSTPVRPEANFGFGVLRVFERLEAANMMRDRHMLSMVKLYQRLQEPVAPLLAAPDADLLRQVDAHHRRTNEKIMQWERRIAKKGAGS